MYAVAALFTFSSLAVGHGTLVSPMSRVYRVYLSNPENPDFALAQAAVDMDGSQSYYNWNELSRNIPEAVQAGLPPGFSYEPWLPNGHIASGGRIDANTPDYTLTYLGLDQASRNWPTTAVLAGDTIEVDFYSTAQHVPSVWDVWMTTSDWQPDMPLTWDHLEFLGRPSPILNGEHFIFDQLIPENRIGHHVLFVAWQRDDPVGEVFFSASDLLVEGMPCGGDLNGDGIVTVADLLVVLDGWGTNGAGADIAPPLNVVDVADVLVIIAAWGGCG